MEIHPVYSDPKIRQRRRANVIHAPMGINMEAKFLKIIYKQLILQRKVG